MNHALQLGMSTQLVLTQELRQFFRLLQLSAPELHEELQNALADNPLLECDEGEPGALPARPGAAVNEQCAASTSAAPADDAPPPDCGEIECFDEFSSGSRHDGGEEAEFSQQAADTPNLREHLMAQLALTRLSARDKSMVATLIAALDESGYLSESLEDIAELLPPELQVERHELDIALRHLHNFDPVGVGARTPAECMELQLRALPADTPARALALDIVHNYLPELAARDFARLKRQLRCDDINLGRARQLIQSLNPRPGAQFGSDETRYIVPEVIVKKMKNRWIASLNPDAMPKLRVNRVYAEIVQDGQRGARGPMSTQLQEARWLIKNVEARYQTILRVAQAIIDRQQRFFDRGEAAMQPLLHREIADGVGVHRSTISRVTRQKFMATPRGIFELNYFFSSQVGAETGDACSATAVRAFLKQLILDEDRRNPLSDDKIAQIFNRHGIAVARRTIAKYRGSLRVPPANLRMAM